MERRLAAILAADVAGYSRLMEQDETDTFERLRAHRKELFEPEIEKHHGRIFKLMGDGLLAEFGSVVDAVDCAVSLQRGMAERNAGVPEARRIDVRMGVNLGDVIIEGDDRHGEGINIAARLQELAEPGGICVSQQAVDQVERKLAVDYEDLGEHSVKNIVKPVHVYRVRCDGVRAARVFRRTWRHRPALIIAIAILLAAAGGLSGWYWNHRTSNDLPPLPKGPKIAVLPFINKSDNPEDAYFADALSEEIITGLSRFSDLFVFPLAATIEYKGEPVDPRAINRDLGARYVLGGSVRRSQDHLRVTVDLLDAMNAKVLWSNVYDRELTTAEIFTVLDDISGQVAAAIGTETSMVWVTEVKTEQPQRTSNLEAYECTLLATVYFENFAGDVRGRVRSCLERAVKLDPGYPRAWATLAEMYIETYKNEPSLPDSPSLLDLAEQAAQKAIAIDHLNQDGHYHLAIISHLRGQSMETYNALAEAAIALNPNSAGIVGNLGNFMAYAGEWDRGKALLERMMKLNPRYPSWAHFVFFLDHYRKGEFHEALTRHLQINLPNVCMFHWSLAAVYGQLGESEKAKAALYEMAAINPPCPKDPREPFVKRRMYTELVESVMDGLRKAGVDVPPADE